MPITILWRMPRGMSAQFLTYYSARELWEKIVYVQEVMSSGRWGVADVGRWARNVEDLLTALHSIR